MAPRVLRSAGLAVTLTAVTLAGCANYIKRDEYDAAIADLRAADQRMQSQIDALSQKYDALVTQVAGRIRVETGARFATGDATLGEEDKPLLDDFAKAITSSHSDAVITVEGLADPAGSTGFNQRLGMRRAEAVRDYLVGTAGMQAGQVRAVSYGEATNRQVRPGATATPVETTAVSRWWSTTPAPAASPCRPRLLNRPKRPSRRRRRKPDGARARSVRVGRSGTAAAP